MPKIKRFLIWLVEIVVEALLLGFFFGVLLASDIGVINGVGGGVLVIPVLLLLQWYYLSRTLVVAVWYIRPPLYPVIAAALFVAHMGYFLYSVYTEVSAAMKAVTFPFLAGGACIVFGCAFAGNWLLRKWNRTPIPASEQ